METGRLQTEEEVESEHSAHTRCPRKSIRRGFSQLHMPRSTIHRSFRVYAYKVRLLQVLKPEDWPRRKEFAVSMLHRLVSSLRATGGASCYQWRTRRNVQIHLKNLKYLPLL